MHMFASVATNTYVCMDVSVGTESEMETGTERRRKEMGENIILLKLGGYIGTKYTITLIFLFVQNLPL